ncbi:MAG: hypothetical protein HY901_22110 [Deltaproteobacteria bacterium]|nr:hypothetical protein [Deltaproteobacteria bacterium]
MTMALKTFRPNPRLRRWLRSGTEEASAPGLEPDWDGWLLRRMSQGRITTIGGVLVDRELLSQRFACVSDRCAPRAGRGAWRSCCADLEVGVDGGEQRRLARAAKQLPEGYCEHGHLTRPDGRCAFAQLDLEGRIRCRLHGLARRRGIERSELQPLSCRLFPLIVLDFGPGRVVLTLVSKSTWRLMGGYPPGRYPCLTEPSLPPLVESMKGDLDWAFGKGFARALAKS